MLISNRKNFFPFSRWENRGLESTLANTMKPSSDESGIQIKNCLTPKSSKSINKHIRDLRSSSRLIPLIFPETSLFKATCTLLFSEGPGRKTEGGQSCHVCSGSLCPLAPRLLPTPYHVISWVAFILSLALHPTVSLHTVVGDVQKENKMESLQCSEPCEDSLLFLD